MHKYDVWINPQAAREIEEIYDYISSVKRSPETAKKQCDRIRQAIMSLEIFPEGHQYRTSGRYSGSLYRQLLIDNYVAIFKIDEASKAVYVVTVQYQGRNV